MPPLLLLQLSLGLLIQPPLLVLARTFGAWRSPSLGLGWHCGGDIKKGRQGHWITIFSLTKQQRKQCLFGAASWHRAIYPYIQVRFALLQPNHHPIYIPHTPISLAHTTPPQSCISNSPAMFSGLALSFRTTRPAGMTTTANEKRLPNKFHNQKSVGASGTFIFPEVWEEYQI